MEAGGGGGGRLRGGLRNVESVPLSQATLALGLSLSLLSTLRSAKSPRPGWVTPFLLVSTPLPCDVMAGVGSPIPGS